MFKEKLKKKQKMHPMSTHVSLANPRSKLWDQHNPIKEKSQKKNEAQVTNNSI